MNRRRGLLFLWLAVTAAAALLAAGCAGGGGEAAPAPTTAEESAAATETGAAATGEAALAPGCSFELRIGSVQSFTGDLAAYGPNFARAVQLAVDRQNAALQELGLSSQISVNLVASEDDQGQPSAAVEAATKLVTGDNVDVLIGTTATATTLPILESVTVPNNVVLIAPTPSAPQLSQIAPPGYFGRVYPSDDLEGEVLAQAAIDAFGEGAVVNIGARNDAFGASLVKLFSRDFAARGGTVGKTVLWNPGQANYDSEAEQLVSGAPAGWVLGDFPDTFQKLVASLVRTGKWEASRTFVNEALRNTEQLTKLGEPANGLRGTAASSSGPGAEAFASLWKAEVTGADPYTGFEPTSFDAANLAFLAALSGCSSEPSSIAQNLREVSGPPGTKVSFQDLPRAIELALQGEDLDYDGAWGPIDLNERGDPTAAVFEIWQFENGEISTLETVTSGAQP